MTAASPAIFSLNSGEVSPLLEGRVDLDTYSSSCQRMRDFIPLVQGPITKRPPTQFINEIKDSSKAVRLIPFEFSVEQAYVLEFGDLYVRVYKDNGIVLDGAGPAVYEFVSPYPATELANIYFAQQNDIMLLAHPNYPPHRLSRLDHDDWTLEEDDTEWGPFLDENLDDTITVSASAVTGTITLTASSALFQASHVGAFWRIAEPIASNYNVWETDKAYTVGTTRYWGNNVYITTNAATSGVNPPVHLTGTETDGVVNWQYLHSGEGYVRITAFTSDTVVTAEVIERLPSTSALDTWSEGAWSDVQGYPATVAFYEARLFWAGTNGRPQTIWGSKTDEYNNYQGGSKASDGLRYTISTDRVNAIRWLAPSKSMAIGTSGGEFTMSGGSADSALTPSNVRIVRESTYGSADFKPLTIGPKVIFIQRGGKKVREYSYEYDSDSYLAPDLTIKADNITLQGVGQMAYQQSPYQIIWMVRGDGKLLGMTYNVEQKVHGWHLHTIAGGQVESIAVIPDDATNEDQLWMVVRRTIDGQTKKYVEILKSDEVVRIGGDLTNVGYIDSQLTYTGAPTDTITGLDHLEGETVGIRADGSEHPDVVVTSGSITLTGDYSNVVVGLRYQPLVETMRIEAGAADGTAQGKTKRLHNITLRVNSASSGVFYGATDDKLYEIHLRAAGDDMDAPVPVFTGDLGPKVWPSGYEKGGRIVVEHRGTGPFILVGLFPQLKTQDRG